MEPGTMQRPPRKPEATFLSFRQLMLSIIQGLMITGACLGIGYFYMQQGEDDGTVRTVIFITLLFSNIFLTLVNRSFIHSVFTTLRYKNNLITIIISVTLLFIAASIYVPFVRDIFLLKTISINTIISCALAAMTGTLWIEGWKFARRKLLWK
jgi:Ca2+-transporting ATPase